MGSDHYHRIVGEWCSVAGTRSWDSEKTVHVEIDGVTVGLLGDAHDRVLNVYCDMGSFDEHTDAELLALNVEPEIGGCFGRHPHSEAIFFRATIPLTADTDGTALPRQISSIIHSARHCLPGRPAQRGPTNMGLQQADRVIREWCAATGMEAWGVGEKQYVRIDDAAVCLTVEAAEPSAMRILCDLGPIDDPEGERKLLMLNFFDDPHVPGFFGMDPESGHAIYRQDVPLQPDIGGGDIPEHIAVSMEVVRSRLFGHPISASAA